MTTDSQDCYSRAALSEPGMAVQAATTTVSPPHHPVLSLPHQPLRSCAAEAPGIERHTALNSIFFFLLLSCILSYHQLSPPSPSKIHCICYRSQYTTEIKCHKFSCMHQRRVIWKAFYNHLSPLMANPNASNEPTVMWPHSSTDLFLMCNL